METIDLKKQHKSLYQARQTPARVTAPMSSFLAVEGTGKPGDDGFQRAIERLYGIAYTLKFGLLHAGKLDFRIPNLECLWLACPGGQPEALWTWRLLVRVPDEIGEADVQAAIAQLAAKKSIDARDVALLRWEEGPTVQVLHVGPYETVAQSYERLSGFAAEQGLPLQDVGHEVYLSDPRRTAPERLKTIVRIPVVT